MSVSISELMSVRLVPETPISYRTELKDELYTEIDTMLEAAVTVEEDALIRRCKIRTETANLPQKYYLKANTMQHYAALSALKNKATVTKIYASESVGTCTDCIYTLNGVIPNHVLPPYGRYGRDWCYKCENTEINEADTEYQKSLTNLIFRMGQVLTKCLKCAENAYSEISAADVLGKSAAQNSENLENDEVVVQTVVFKNRLKAIIVHEFDNIARCLKSAVALGEPPLNQVLGDFKDASTYSHEMYSKLCETEYKLLRPLSIDEATKNLDDEDKIFLNSGLCGVIREFMITVRGSMNILPESRFIDPNAILTDNVRLVSESVIRANCLLDIVCFLKKAYNTTLLPKIHDSY